MRDMADAKTRAQNILKALPLSRTQREFYERGVDAMDEATLEVTNTKLESTFSQVPGTLAAARDLLANQQAPAPKRAVILVADKNYRRVLTEMLRQQMEIETPDAPEEAIEMIARISPDIVICDLVIPAASGMDVIRQMRRAASVPPTIFVRTSNPEEDGQAAAAGATGYRVSNPATDLKRAVTSAIKASALLADSDKV